MAGENHTPSDADVLANLFTKLFPWLVAALVFFLLWRYNAWKGALALVGTIFLGWSAWKLWVHYIRQDFISGIDYVLLEIVPPREVERNPKAMELFITNALYHFSYKGGKEEYWQGAVWFWFSLEIASIDGQVHFYIRTPTRIRSLIETQMYAQFPQAQVKAVEDYTLAVDEITPESDWNGWGCEFKLLKPEAYPIRTYLDYGLEEDPKEEYKIDPISPLIELFGSIQKGEQMWMQIVITPSKKTYRTKGTWFGKHDWVDESRAQTLKILDPYTRIFAPSVEGASPTKGVYAPVYLTATLERISQKRDKLGFDSGVRIMYIAKKEIFPPGRRTNNSRNIRLIFRQYTNPSANGFDRFNSTQGDAYGGIITITTKTVMMLANRMLNHYRERLFFHEPLRYRIFNKHYLHWPLSLLFHAYFHSQTFVLNAEELATLWHFPGQIMKVPSLERIESKEASPPPNLPT